MAPVDKPEDAEPDDEEASADLYLVLPFDQRGQQRKGEEYDEHRKQMAGR